MALAKLSQLFEARVTPEALKQIHTSISTAHDPNATFQHPSDIIDHFANNGDPTKDKTYTPWIVNKYKKQDFRQEDTGRVNDALSAFHQEKKNLPVKDINQYKSLDDVENAVNRARGIGSKIDTGFNHPEAPEIHNNNGLVVNRLDSQAASESTRNSFDNKWCTAVPNNRMFANYSKDGPLYVVRTPDNKRYQFHFGSSQFMDHNDKPVDVEKLVSKHPELTNVRDFAKDPLYGHNFTNDKNEKTAGQIAALDSGNEEASTSVSNSKKITPEALDHALQHKNPTIATNAAANPNIKDKHVATILGSKNDTAKAALAANPALPQEYIPLFMKHEDPAVRTSLGRNPNLNKEQINSYINSKNPTSRVAGISNPSADPDHIEQALGDNYLAVKYTAASHPNITTSQLSRIATDPSFLVRRAASSNTSATPEVLQKIIDDPKNTSEPMGHQIIRNAITHPNSTQDQVMKFYRHKNPSLDSASEAVGYNRGYPPPPRRVFGRV